MSKIYITAWYNYKPKNVKNVTYCKGHKVLKSVSLRGMMKEAKQRSPRWYDTIQIQATYNGRTLTVCCWQKSKNWKKSHWPLTGLYRQKGWCKLVRFINRLTA